MRPGILVFVFLSGCHILFPVPDGLGASTEGDGAVPGQDAAPTQRITELAAEGYLDAASQPCDMTASHCWTQKTTGSSAEQAEGEAFVQLLPDDSAYWEEGQSNAPFLRYTVTFPVAGTYYVAARILYQTDSLHKDTT